LEESQKIAEARRIYQETGKLGETAQQVGVGRHKVKKWISDLVPDMEKLKQLARDLYQNETVNLTDIARRVGVTSTTIKSWVSNLIPEKSDISAEMQLAREIYQETGNIRLAAQTVGRGWSQIRNWVKDIKPPEKRRRTRFPLSKKQQAREIYQKTGKLGETSRQVGVFKGIVKDWVSDIEHIDPRIEEARKIYRETNSIVETMEAVGATFYTVRKWVENLISKKRHLRRRNPDDLEELDKMVEARKLREGGMAIDKILVKLGLSYNKRGFDKVHSWVDDITYHISLTDKHHDVLLGLYNQKLNDRQIARQANQRLGTTFKWSHVQSWRNRHGLAATLKKTHQKLDLALAIQLAEEGKTSYEIVPILDTSRATLRRQLKKASLFDKYSDALDKAKKSKKQEHIALLEEKIKSLYQEGLSDLNIAEQLGIGRTYVAEWRDKRNLPSNHYVSIDEEMVKSLREAGNSVFAISRQMGVSRSVIDRILRRRNPDDLERLEKIAEARKLRSQGLSKGQIIKKLWGFLSPLRWQLINEWVEDVPFHAGPTYEHHNTLLALYQQGLSDGQISAKLKKEGINLSKVSVRVWRNRNSLEPNRKARKKRSIDVDEVIDLALKGYLIKDITKELDMNIGTLYRLLEARGALEQFESAQIEGKTILDHEIIDKAIKLALQGKTRQQIAKVLEVSATFAENLAEKYERRQEFQQALREGKARRPKLIKLHKHPEDRAVVVTAIALSGKIQKLYDKGLTDGRIAEQLGTYRDIIIQWRKQENLPSNHKISFDEVKVLELYEAGLNDSQIARELNIGRTHIWKWRNQKDLLPNRRKVSNLRRRNPDDLEELEKMVEARELYLAMPDKGRSYTKVAAQLGISPTTVGKWTADLRNISWEEAVDVLRTYGFSLNRLAEILCEQVDCNPESAVNWFLKRHKPRSIAAQQAIVTMAKELVTEYIELTRPIKKKVRGHYPERLKLHQQGLTDKEIAEREGRTIKAIRVWRKSRGLSENIPKSKQQAVLKMYEQGFSDEQIAVAMGVLLRSVKRWRKAGWLPERQDPLLQRFIANVTTLRNRGMSVLAISKQLGVSRTQVYSAIEGRHIKKGPLIKRFIPLNQKRHLRRRNPDDVDRDWRDVKDIAEIFDVSLSTVYKWKERMPAGSVSLSSFASSSGRYLIDLNTIKRMKAQGKLRRFRRNPDDLERLEQIARAIELYQKHKSTPKVAKITGISQATIYKWVKYLITPYAKKQTLDIQQGEIARVEARKLYRKLRNVNAVAKQLKIHNAKIRAWVADIELGEDPRAAEARKIYAETGSLAQTAKDVRAGTKIIKEWVSYTGVDPRRARIRELYRQLQNKKAVARELNVGIAKVRIWVADILDPRAEEARRIYQETQSVRKTADAVGVAANTVKKWIIDLIAEKRQQLTERQASQRERSLVWEAQLWTPKEDQILLQHYNTASKDELLAFLPGRTFDAMRKRTKQLSHDDPSITWSRRESRWIAYRAEQQHAERVAREIARELYQQGFNINKIRKQLGISYDKAKKWVEDLIPKKRCLRRRNPEINFKEIDFIWLDRDEFSHEALFEKAEDLFFNSGLRIGDSQDFCVVAIDEDENVLGAGAHNVVPLPEPPDSYVGGHDKVEMSIAVSPKARKQYIATDLIREIIAHWREYVDDNQRPITLVGDAIHPHSRKMMKRLRFTQITDIPVARYQFRTIYHLDLEPAPADC